MQKKYRIYFGKRFYQQKGGYWANIMPIHAHRWVWINHRGAIPEGMDIHHKDGDKSNNEIENLEMLTRSEHLKRHWKDENLRKERRAFLDKIRLKVHKWLRSEEGRKVQSAASKKAWKTRKKFMLSCIHCEISFESTQPWAKCCSKNCYMKYRRTSGIVDTESKCLNCNQIFLKNKFSHQKFCSISCGAINSSKKRKLFKFQMRFEIK